LELARGALNIALVLLKKGGHFLCKAFESEDTKPFKDGFSGRFDETRIIRPSAVRKTSREIYILGLDFLDRIRDNKQQRTPN
jgi:23S rRNA (uridine2552-2'-O)-methyltransferase